MTLSVLTHTFDALATADLEQVYQQGRAEVLRDHAFSIMLAQANTVAKLEQFAFHSEKGLARWTTKELIEISNRFRLLSSPVNEIRLYRECHDEAFRKAPRVREFYVLALNKLGQPATAMHEAARIIAEGGQNALLWGALGEAYSARMIFAEQIAYILATAEHKRTTEEQQRLNQFPNYFPTLTLAEVTVAHARALRQENLQAATAVFHQGFRESGTSFTGLGWLLRTLDQVADRVVERSRLRRKAATPAEADEDQLRLRLIDDELQSLYRLQANQILLIDIALTLQGGQESLDYWTLAGRLLLAVLQGASMATLEQRLRQLFAVVDADFKLTITVAELRRLSDQIQVLHEHEAADSAAPSQPAQQLAAAKAAVAACAARLQQGAPPIPYLPAETAPRSPEQGNPCPALATFLEKTINFRALTGSLVPLFIHGAIGRVGARVPDLLINRQVQEDLLDLIETQVLPALSPAERTDPQAVCARIQKVVGAGLRIGDLQDLQSAAHEAFDLRSDGLIALSGVDHDMRRFTRTATDLTAALLMQNGDCRETMYLNGALFACWQQMQVKQHIAKALRCLDLDFQAGFATIVEHEIPRFLRYQLRGGQVAIYVEDIAMQRKYQSVRAVTGTPVALARGYGVDALRSEQPLTAYEVANAKIAVTTQTGQIHWLEPQQSASGADDESSGGIPLLATMGLELGQVRELQLLNLVEEHAMTFLYDEQQQTVTLCDGFYNQHLFASPYAFGSGTLNLTPLTTPPGLLAAGQHTLLHPDGKLRPHPVYLQFLPFSQTDYAAALVEGDIPGTIQLMGRTFSVDLQYERRRLADGTSPIPGLLEKIHQWQLQRHHIPLAERNQVERQLTRFILDLARQQPELIELREVSAAEPLLIEGRARQSLYLVLSGQLTVSRRGQILRDPAGNAVTAVAGSILGEIAALRGGGASATVAGQAVVLGIPQEIIQQYLQDDATLRGWLEMLASYHYL